MQVFLTFYLFSRSAIVLIGMTTYFVFFTCMHHCIMQSKNDTWMNGSNITVVLGAQFLLIARIRHR